MELCDKNLRGIDKSIFSAQYFCYPENVPQIKSINLKIKKWAFGNIGEKRSKVK